MGNRYHLENVSIRTYTSSLHFERKNGTKRYSKEFRIIFTNFIFVENLNSSKRYFVSSFLLC